MQQPEYMAGGSGSDNGLRVDDSGDLGVVEKDIKEAEEFPEEFPPEDPQSCRHRDTLEQRTMAETKKKTTGGGGPGGGSDKKPSPVARKRWLMTKRRRGIKSTEKHTPSSLGGGRPGGRTDKSSPVATTSENSRERWMMAKGRRGVESTEKHEPSSLGDGEPPHGKTIAEQQKTWSTRIGRRAFQRQNTATAHAIPAKEKTLTLDDQYQAPPDRRKDNDERYEPVEITGEEFNSHPGAYRIPGFLGDEEDGDEEDSHFHGTITIPVTTLASSHAFVSQPEFVVPIARTVDSKIFEAVPLDDGVKRQRRRVIMTIVVGVLVIVGVILAVVFGRKSGDPPAATPPPTPLLRTMTPTRKEVEWVQRGSAIVGEAECDEAGHAVSLSGDGTVLAVAAFLHDGINGEDSGHVRVYNWLESEWIQQGFNIDGEAIGDQSGTAIALSSDGSILAISAFLNDGDGLNEVGHVRVFEWSGTEWLQRGRDLDGKASIDRSGFSLALSSNGSIVAIGSPGNDSNGELSGHARVFQWSGSEWNQLGMDIVGESAGDLSGESVSLSSDGLILAIGAPLNDGETGSDSGHVRVFQWSGTEWEQRGSDIDGEAAGDESGRYSSVVMTRDGNTVAIRSTNNNGKAAPFYGHVRVFDWSGEGWVQRGSNIEGETGIDSGMAISSDGNIIAIGADFNRANGSVSGTVRVFIWTGREWLQQGVDFDGEASGDLFGLSIAMSSDGKTLAIGAPWNDDNGEDAGHVRIYELAK